MHAGSDYMLPPCSLPNRCSPTCACGGYGAADENEGGLSPVNKVLFATFALVIGSAFAGAYYADHALKRRLVEQEMARQRFFRRR